MSNYLASSNNSNSNSKNEWVDSIKNFLTKTQAIILNSRVGTASKNVGTSSKNSEKGEVSFFHT